MKNNYKVFGQGETVVLVHGSMGSKEQWRPLATELSKEFQVVTFDLLGYGQSPWPASPPSYCLADESQHLLFILDQIQSGDAPYHLVGHSYGGAVALAHACHFREHIKSLTLIEPMSYHLLPKDHPLLLGSQMMIQELTADIEKGNAISAARKFIDLWMAPGSFDRRGEQEQEILAKGVKKMVFDFYSAASEPISPEDISDLTMPLCLITGKKSPPYSISISEVVAEAVRQRQLHHVEGGHFAPFTHGPSVNPHIAKFLHECAQQT